MLYFVLATLHQTRRNTLSYTRSTQEYNKRHHPVLVIWPKHHTIRIYCQFGFNAVLDRMEAAVDISSHHRLELIADLGIVLSFCRTEPYRVWGDTTTKAGQRTFRLFRLCTFLRASGEGLDLIDLLATGFKLAPKDIAHNLIMKNSAPSEEYSYEGIRSEEVADAIAQFISLVCGWPECRDRVIALVGPARIVDQLIYLVSLVRNLIRRSCLEGAINLMDCISSTLSNLEASVASTLKQAELNAYVDQVIAMESHSTTSNSQRLAAFSAFFPRLDFCQQCQLTVNLQKDKFKRLLGLPTCHQMFKNICRALSYSELQSAENVSSVIVQLLKCYVDLGDENLLQTLTGKICSASTSTLDAPYPSNKLLEAVLLSSETWDMVTSVELGKKTVTSLVVARIKSFISMFDQPLPGLTKEIGGQGSDSVDHSWMFQPCQEVFRSNLSISVHQVLLLERKEAFVNQQQLDLLAQLYFKLPLKQLYYLVLDLRELDNPHIKEKPSSFSLFVELCQALVNRSKDALPNVPHDAIIKVLKTFIWLGDVLLVRSLVKQICLIGSGKSWDPTDKNKLLEAILTSPESWGQVSPGSHRLIRDSSTALIGAWIIGLCRVLDEVEASAVPGKKADGLRNKIATCVNIFIRAEKSQARADQPNVATFFTLLLSKLSQERLCHLINDLRKMDNLEASALKLPPCSTIYRDLCCFLLANDMTSFIKTCGWLVNEVWKSILWFDDEDLLMTLSHKILDAFPSNQDNLVIAKMLASTDLRNLVQASKLGRTTFCLFLEQRIEYLKSMAQPFLSWDFPFAVVQGHPEVEAFLRANQKTIMYSCFTSFKSACMFSTQFSGYKNGYSIRVIPAKFERHSECKIEKTLSRNALLKKETKDLEEFHLLLKEKEYIETTEAQGEPVQLTKKKTLKVEMKREVTEEDEMTSVLHPTTKRFKKNTFFLNITDY